MRAAGMYTRLMRPMVAGSTDFSRTKAGTRARHANNAKKFRRQGGIVRQRREDGTITQMVFNGMEEKTAIWIT